jgi:microcystin-dependent protein
MPSLRAGLSEIARQYCYSVISHINHCNMKTIFYLLPFILFGITRVTAQNVGIGTQAPVEKLDVAGNIKTNGLIVTNGGSALDFIIKNDGTGTVGFRKGHGALAIRYIICVEGIYPSESVALTGESFLGEIKMFAGNFAPRGWRFCEGQLLPISQNQALFSLLLFTYGGNGQTNFALPDLRGAAPVSTGTSVAGYTWSQGQKTN